MIVVVSRKNSQKSKISYSVIRNSLFSILMFYYLKIFFRNLRRGGIYSAINIGGLAIGMAATILIVLWVHNQWSYERFHEKEKQLYQLWSHNEKYGTWESTPKIIGPTLVEEYSDITNMTRFKEWSRLVTYGDRKINLQAARVDPGFLTMFSFPLLQGDINTALNAPYSIVLTQDAAKRLFGDEDPIGKTVTLQAKHPTKVTGVLADLPQNTCFRFDALQSWEVGPYEDVWTDYSTITYLELKPGSSKTDVDAAIKGIIRQHTGGKDTTEPFLHPISQWHLYSEFENGKAAGGLIGTLRMFFLIAVLILLTACINFMNLSTARSFKRAREVGVRKVMGARRSKLIKLFLGESVLVSAIAAAFAIAIVCLFLSPFNSLTGEQLRLDFSRIGFWGILLAFTSFTGILAGSYPAFYLSSFLPVKVLKNVFKNGQNLITPRKLLIVTQFTIAVILIISTAVIHRQVRYAQDRNTGYNKDQLIYTKLNEQMDKNQDLIRQELLRTGTATSVTRTLSSMTDQWSATWAMGWQGKDPENRTVINRSFVDAGWTETTGITILQGRDIDIYNHPTDTTAMLLNEAAVKVMGFDDPIGQIIRESGRDFHVVGVVKDFVIESPYEPVAPMVIAGPARKPEGMHIRLNGANHITDNLAQVEKIFKTYNPDFPFEYIFIDESYARKFVNEQHTGKLVTWFALLVVFISCLGLFGLSAHAAENRRKEIGIRKVLGASVADITSLLSREFLILVTVSLVIATPIAWWAMNQWLSGYAYRTNIPWWLFAAVAILTIGIALLTVSWQAIKAAIANPVKAIKAE